MDKKRSVLNVTISIISKIVMLILAIVVRRILIDNAGNDANGVFSLYTNIIGFLAIAELGVGTAINFSIYKPIVQGDTKKVAALYNLYKKVYLVIGIIIGILGLAIIPALPQLAKDYNSSFSLALTFGIMLIDVVLTYAYSSKTSLINAYKNNYITTLFTFIKTVTYSVIQIVVLIATQSFELYLIARVISTLLEWLMTNIYARKHYGDVINTKEKIDEETKKEVVKNTKAMFMHKIGAVFVTTTDSIIISAFIGVVTLGLYTNYVVIASAVLGILQLFFTPLTSIVGHLCAEGNTEEQLKYFNLMYYFNFTIGIIFFLGFYAIADNLVAICFGKDLVMDFSISLIIAINYFIQYMRTTALLFKDATGTFYYDRWKPVVEGVVNIILSIALVNVLGIVGVIIATIATNIFICHIVDPYVLYKHGFKQKMGNYYLINYSLVLIFVACIAVLHFVKVSLESVFLELVVNGCIAVGIALVPIIIMFIVFKQYRENVKIFFGWIKKVADKIFKKH